MAKFSDYLITTDYDRTLTAPDSSVPQAMDGLNLEYSCFGRKFTFVYHITGEAIRAVSNGMALEGVSCANPYRRGGLLLSRDVLANCGDTIEIFC